MTLTRVPEYHIVTVVPFFCNGQTNGDEQSCVFIFFINKTMKITKFCDGKIIGLQRKIIMEIYIYFF